jgi:hypothetical protein
MNYGLRTITSLCTFFLCLMGCGGGGVPSAPPKSQVCTGIAVAGVLHDSLTNLPVAKGWVAIESAVPPLSASTVSFSQPQTVLSDVTGAFQACTTSASQPMVVVIVAQDSAGNAYPPFVEQISTTTNLGTIPMGGCTVICGLDNQKQTSAPAVIKGEITSSPVSNDGSVVPKYAMKSLDGSTATIWNVSFPKLNDGQSYTFSTVANGCSDQMQFCAVYTFLLPSQNAVTPTKGGYRRSNGAPVYSVLAESANSSTCTPASISTYFEKDGKTALTGSPGAQLSAQDIMFSGCH